MYNLKQAASIAIIGGADGPTSIYVAKGSLLTFIILYIVVPAILFALAIFFLVRSIKKKQKARTIIFAILSGIFFLIPIFLILCYSKRTYQFLSSLSPADKLRLSEVL